MIQFKVKDQSIPITVQSAVKVGSSGEIYNGSYEITPTVDGLTVETKDKYMQKNVDIRPIQFFSVTNTSGGNTVYIGSEVLTDGE